MTELLPGGHLNAVVRDGARKLRRLHDASIGFGLDGAVWQSPAKVPAEVICHNDFAPHNLAFDDGMPVGAIDFDMCSPGPRLGKPELNDDAGPYERDARYLAALREGEASSHGS
ncbi:phosphotransferase [Arthrobacter dokdonensis]|uniref:phosphotransferase n=1 Tax=Arthrobacter dokdonellae TaxID=2211210 RepID=UPI000DE5A8A8|nr:phosphotransferase [Arthrobacter dokdonellae]